MVVVYADDEHTARQQVSRALRLRGHTVITLDTGSAMQLEEQVARLLSSVRENGLVIDVLVLDGHNYLLDENGHLLADMTPRSFLEWLWQNKLCRECHYILYTNDSGMVAEAQLQKSIRFAATICKVGVGGGLQALLESLEHL
jgi:CheY-like chemotaxis protein